MALPIAQEWFDRRSLADGVTLLSERYVDPFARCNVWHVRGRDRDLLIDTGLGVRSLREAAAEWRAQQVASSWALSQAVPRLS